MSQSSEAWFWVRIGMTLFLLATAPLVFTIGMWWWIEVSSLQCPTADSSTPAPALPSKEA